MKYEVEVTHGDTYWRFNDKLHREDGPAIEDASGTRSWWMNGKLHREDGPAIEYADGSKSWYVNDEEFSEQEFNSRFSAREMTVAEISRALGFEVKVVR